MEASTSQIHSESSEEKRIFCRMTSEIASIDWLFVTPSKKFKQSEVFQMDKHYFKWRLCYTMTTTEIGPEAFGVHYIFLELVSKVKCNILAETRVAFRPGDSKTETFTRKSNVSFTVGKYGYIHLIARFMNKIDSECQSCGCTICKCKKTYRCKVSVYAEYPMQKEEKKNKFKETVLSSLVGFCNCNDFDLKIVVNSTTFPVHRMILAARSKVFLAMFQHEMKDPNCNVINIVDFDEETIHQLTKFLYTSSLTKKDTDLLLQLLMVSEKYKICDLQYMCEAMLILKMNVWNVVDIFKQALVIESLTKLRNVAMALIKTDPDIYLAELKEKLVPVNSLFVEIEKLLQKSDMTEDIIKKYMIKGSTLV